MDCYKRHQIIPCPVKLFMGLIFFSEVDIDRVRDRLIKRFGQIELESPILPFTHTTYYNEEMGDTLFRCFWGFKECISPDQLVKIKLITNALEMKLGVLKKDCIFRLVNLDPGTLSLSNIILATTKNMAHRIYLGKGIFAEITLLYSRVKGWQPLDWTYPDFRTPVTLGFFQRLRDIYHQELKNLDKN